MLMRRQRAPSERSGRLRWSSFSEGLLSQELSAARHAVRHRGVCRFAGVYSIVVAVKTNELNQCKYVQWLLKETPNAEDPGDPAYPDSLMPWSDSVPTDIRPKPKPAEEAARMADDPIIDIDLLGLLGGRGLGKPGSFSSPAWMFLRSRAIPSEQQSNRLNMNVFALLLVDLLIRNRYPHSLLRGFR